MLQSTTTKILLIRFSSFGDITQSLSLPSRLAELGGEVHWVTRKDFTPLLQGHPAITKIWSLDRKQGMLGLFQLIFALRKENFTHIYDAHNNLRSHLICWFLRPPLAIERILNPPFFVRKSQKRWKRFLLFRLRKNTYEMPFSGQRDLLEPLTPWGLEKTPPPAPQMFLPNEVVSKVRAQVAFETFFTVAPSAAHALKRWPLEHFKNLLLRFPSEKFICLGGPEDTFIQELVKVAPDRIANMAGKFSLQESAAAISLSKGLVTNDTGLLHVAEQLGKRAIALMGPAPFGFPSRKSTTIMELNLACRPCSKHGQGPCVNEKFQRCMVDITPAMVEKEIRAWG